MSKDVDELHRILFGIITEYQDIISKLVDTLTNLYKVSDNEEMIRDIIYVAMHAARVKSERVDNLVAELDKIISDNLDTGPSIH